MVRRLLADYHDGEGVRHHGAADAATSTGRRRSDRGGGSGELGCDQRDVVGLAVQGEGLGADGRRHGLFHDEGGRVVFLDYGQRAAALRTEGFHGGGVEDGAIRAGAEGQGGDELAIVGIEHHHVRRLAAGGEEGVVLYVEGEGGGGAALFAGFLVGRYGGG